jgi:hypothetical protein
MNYRIWPSELSRIISVAALATRPVFLRENSLLAKGGR